MSVIGIDLGNMNTVVAVARNRGIDVICNEVSNRLSPTMVSFGAKSRYLGEAAKTMELSNYRNTIAQIKRLLLAAPGNEEVWREEAPAFQHLDIQFVEHLPQITIQKEEGENKTYTLVQLLAMYFGYIKGVAQEALGPAIRVADCVLAVPAFFNDFQRRVLLDAAKIVHLNVLSLINETTASALAYGLTRGDLLDAAVPKNVCFVDVGHSSTQVSIVALTKDRLEVRGCGWDSSLGGRSFDQALAEHFASQFSSSHSIDIRSNAKAMHRLAAACERAKKVLSANAKTVLAIESLMDDKDVSAPLSRELFEGLVGELVERLDGPLAQALSAASLSPSDIATVEVVGGGTRIPAVKQRIADFFGPSVPLSFCLNQDEAVARGAAFHCASLSPVFKVKPFSMVDISPHGYRLSFSSIDPVLVMPPAGQTLPAGKLVTLSIPEGSLVFAVETLRGGDAEGKERAVAQYSLAGVVGDQVRLKARLSASGLFSLQQSTEEGREGEAPSLTLLSSGSLSSAAISALASEEAEMAASDKLVFDTEAARNALEEYIYEMREKISPGGSLEPFLDTSSLSCFSEALGLSEAWLYDDHGSSGASKSAFLGRLSELRAFGDPAMARCRFLEHAQTLAGRFSRDADKVLKSSTNGGDDREKHAAREALQARVVQVSGMVQSLEGASKPSLDPSSVSLSSIELELDALLKSTNDALQKTSAAPPAASVSSEPAASVSSASSGEAPEMDLD